VFLYGNKQNKITNLIKISKMSKMKSKMSKMKSKMSKMKSKMSKMKRSDANVHSFSFAASKG